MQLRRDRIPCKSVWFPTPEAAEAQAAINGVCGEIMHAERCIINALLRGKTSFDFVKNNQQKQTHD